MDFLIRITLFLAGRKHHPQLHVDSTRGKQELPQSVPADKHVHLFDMLV